MLFSLRAVLPFAVGLVFGRALLACSGSSAQMAAPIVDEPDAVAIDVVSDAGSAPEAGEEKDACPASCGRCTECAIGPFNEKVWTWDQVHDKCSYSNNGNPFWEWVVRGREPTEPATYPVFLYLVGTGDTATSPVAIDIVERMAARGYVAASIPYASLDGIGAVMNDPTEACSIAAKKGSCLFGSGEGSAVSRVCARAKADCSRGIVVAGHSQGAWLATLAKDHEPRVRAVLGLGNGVHERVSIPALNLDVAADLSACILPKARALPADRLRVVNGEAEYAYGTSLEADMRAITGIDCPSGKLDCLRPNGSGWAFFPNAASETDVGGPDGGLVARHCFFANTPPGDCGETYAGLNSTWAKGTAPHSREPNLTWLASFTDPPAK